MGEGGEGGKREGRDDVPASNSIFLVKIFMRSFITESVGERTSLNKINPIIIGISLLNPNASYKLRLLINTLKRLNTQSKCVELIASSLVV